MKQEISKSKIRRIKGVIEAYSKALGLPPVGDPRFTARQHILRVCNARTEIRAFVRPLGGAITPLQNFLFVKWMVEHPLPGVSVDWSIVADRSQNAPHAEATKKIKKKKKKSAAEKSAFYETWDWKQARYRVLQKYGPVCMLCGSTRSDFDMRGRPVRICVDHIKPISQYWELRLDETNLQVLCHDCNKGKGAWDNTDWRPHSKADRRLRQHRA